MQTVQLSVVDAPVNGSDKFQQFLGKLCRKPTIFNRCIFCVVVDVPALMPGRPGRCLRLVHRHAHGGPRSGHLPHFAVFFRTLSGRECPFSALNGQQLLVVEGPGAGVARSFTPR